VYTVVIVSFMVDDMLPLTVSFMVDDMAWTKNGRSTKFQVLHSRLRRHRIKVEFVRVLETLGLMRMRQVFGREFSELATQNKDKKEGNYPRGPPPSRTRVTSTRSGSPDSAIDTSSGTQAGLDPTKPML
jgi:hypothetical protein